MSYHSMTQLEADFQAHYQFCPYCDRKHNRLCAIGYCKLRAAIQRLLSRTTQEDEKEKQKERRVPRRYNRRKITGRYNGLLS